MKEINLEDLIKEYEKEKVYVNKNDSLNKETIIYKIDEKIKNLYIQYTEWQNNNMDKNAYLLHGFDTNLIEKKDILNEIDKKISILKSINKIKEDKKIESWEADNIKGELISFGRQKDSIINTNIGLLLLKEITYKLNSENDDLIRLKKILEQNIDSKDFWIFIRDNFQGYKTRDSLWKKLMSNFTKSYKDDVKEILSKDYDNKNNENIEYPNEKTQDRISKQDYDGSITSAYTELERWSKKVLSVKDEWNTKEKFVKNALSKIIEDSYSQDEKFKKSFTVLISAIRSLEDGLRTMRNTAGDAHSTNAIIDEKLSILYSTIITSLIKFIEKFVEENQ